MPGTDATGNAAGGAAPRGATGPGDGRFVLPLLALTLGHVLSNAVRTMPAIAADVLARDLGVTQQGLAAIVGVFPLAFALASLPAGVALDRYGVRRVGLGLVAIITLGAALAALATGPWSMLLAQVVLGTGCSGVLVTPMTLAARTVAPRQLGLWSGIVLAVGNCGMLLSASPMAWLVEAAGWRAGYWAGVGLGLAALALIALLVPRLPPKAPGATQAPSRGMAREVRETLQLMVSPSLRGLAALAFGSYALQIGLRGLWGGPWLMEVKGLTRLEAGNVLLATTVALVCGPLLTGVLDRRLGRRRYTAAGGHALAALLAVLMVCGGPGGPLSRLAGVEMLPAWWDSTMLVLFGLSLGVTSLLFALARAAVPVALTGRALSAINIVNFLGTAVLQPLSGPVAAASGVGAAILFLAAATLIGVALFLLLPAVPTGTRL
ncbi:MFS transporter [Roseomonas sp. NAR14]|uniref:MFS transporter n=1 Tax=Roseomonas acroporae TaxID=2937791 RepID=A0A9X1YFK0_9PROT|nr:MFS transporter [Roseomonas acroporae]MCK8785296.1 MFS transporter [Roseomonas acroporae]